MASMDAIICTTLPIRYPLWRITGREGLLMGFIPRTGMQRMSFFPFTFMRLIPLEHLDFLVKLRILLAFLVFLRFLLMQMIALKRVFVRQQHHPRLTHSSR